MVSLRARRVFWRRSNLLTYIEQLVLGAFCSVRTFSLRTPFASPSKTRPPTLTEMQSVELRRTSNIGRRRANNVLSRHDRQTFADENGSLRNKHRGLSAHFMFHMQSTQDSYDGPCPRDEPPMLCWLITYPPDQIQYGAEAALWMGPDKTRR